MGFSYTGNQTGVYCTSFFPKISIVAFSQLMSENSCVLKIPIQKIPVKIFAKSAFLSSDTVILDNTYDTLVRLTVSINKDDYTLKQVVVKKTSFNNNDTTTILANKYYSNETYKTEDLLAKMPGLTVKDDGTLFWENKPISWVKLNGRKLAEDNYFLVTKNLGAKYIYKVDVIKNEIDNANLARVQQGKNLVLNIVTKDSLPSFLPTIDVGGGHKNAYNINTTVLKPKGKLLFVANSYCSNIETDKIKSQQQNENDGLVFYLLQPQSNRGEDFLSQYEKTGKWHSQSLTSSFRAKKFEMTTDLVFRGRHESMLGKKEFNYKIPNQETFSIRESIEDNLSRDEAHLCSSGKYFGIRKLISTFNFKIQAQNHTGNFLDNSVGISIDSLKEKLNKRRTLLSFSNENNWLLNNYNVVSLKSDFVYTNSSIGLSSSTSRLNKLFDLYEGGVFGLIQNVNSIFSAKKVSASIVHSKRISFEASVKMGRIEEKGDSYLNFADSIKRNFPIGYKIDFGELSFCHNFRSEKKKKYYLEVNLRTSNLNFEQFPSTKTLFTYYLKFGKEFNNSIYQWDINLFNEFPPNQYLNGLKMFVNTLSLKDFTNQYTATTTLQGNVSTKRGNVIKGTVDVGLAAEYYPTAISEKLLLNNGVILSSPIFVSNLISISPHITWDKYIFNIKNRLILEFRPHFSTDNQIINHQSLRSQSLLVRTDAKLVSNFKCRVQYEFGFKSQTVLQKTYTDKAFINLFNIFIKSKYDINNHIKIASTLILLPRSKTPIHCLQQFKMAYLPKGGRWKVDLSIINLWDAKQLNNRFEDVYVSTNSSMELAPRRVLIGLSYQ